MLIPQPVRIEVGPEAYLLPSSAGIFAPGGAGPAADLLRELFGPVTGFELPFSATTGPDVIELILDPTLGQPGSEAYRLVVNATGITAMAPALTGLLWAIQALRQLLPPEIYGRQVRHDVQWTVRAATVVDEPRYPWRGLMVDVGRWYKPVEWLYTVVDLVALHRMNILHLHLTEDQGWRFEVLRYPRLTSVGAWRRESPRGHRADQQGDGVPHGGFYTQAELRDLVAYASRRGVTIVPEIDLPGHSQAAIAAYPHLGNQPDRQLEVWTDFGISAHVLNVADSTVSFMRDVLDELLTVFPSAYIHLGGDEVPEQEWAASAEAKTRLTDLGLRRPSDLLGWWMTRLSDHLVARGRRPVLWDELVGAGAPEGAVIMAWRDQDRVAAALAAGHDVVATPHTTMYLNYPEAQGPGEPLSIADGSTTDGVGPLPLERIYRYDPSPPRPLGGPGRVIGAQGNLWTEYAPTPARAEYDLMPRLAAVAEVGWGGPGDEAGLRAGLVEHLVRLDAAGISYRPLDDRTEPAG